MALGLPPQPFVVCTALGAVVAFLTPIGHHGNLLILNPGQYTFGDFLRVGVPLTILISLVSAWLAAVAMARALIAGIRCRTPVWFGFRQVGRRARDSQIPPPINVSADRRPRNFARAGFMNHARPSPDATAQNESLRDATTAVTRHMTQS